MSSSIEKIALILEQQSKSMNAIVDAVNNMGGLVNAIVEDLRLPKTILDTIAQSELPDTTGLDPIELLTVQMNFVLKQIKYKRGMNQNIVKDACDKAIEVKMRETISAAHEIFDAVKIVNATMENRVKALAEQEAQCIALLQDVCVRMEESDKKCHPTITQLKNEICAMVDQIRSGFAPMEQKISLVMQSVENRAKALDFKINTNKGQMTPATIGRNV